MNKVSAFSIVLFLAGYLLFDIVHGKVSAQTPAYADQPFTCDHPSFSLHTISARAHILGKGTVQEVAYQLEASITVPRSDYSYAVHHIESAKTQKGHIVATLILKATDLSVPPSRTLTIKHVFFRPGNFHFTINIEKDFSGIPDKVICKVDDK